MKSGTGRPTGPPARGRTAVPATAALLVALLVLCLLSLLIGTGSSSPARAWDYLTGDPSARADPQLRLAVVDVRLPRTLAAVMVGLCLGTAGCLLQAATRNPLAETGLLGVNSGAAFAVVVGLTFFDASSPTALLVWALGGGMAASAVVLLLAASGRAAGSPLRLVLAGSALGATFHGMTSYVLLGTQSTFDVYRYWTIGSLAGVRTSELLPLLPLVAVGLAVALGCARPLAALGLGDDSARSLGHHPGRVRLVVAGAVSLLAGCAVAVAGPIAFLGLLAPYAARAVVGASMSGQLVLSALIAADVMIVADLLARVVIRPWEAPVSVLLAFVGGPLLVWIARSSRLSTAGATS
ncbi:MULTISPECIES: FecCD family ABC transporter permease [Streptomyces]|uniref:FecCD family ABC transporter permease n=1 Tax=Streptomyces TaxID=1883 RepID=UPI0013BDC9D5|nr:MULTISPECIES: iron ABC transporter permease [Streptomyces]MBY8866763.1 iron ABC transporter permease [Streptomyces sennicomposti]MYX42602.1 iron chelate uptake ABC transporter family permease subunit [Streptomyces sp. SID89]NED32091.1 iron ABC transporter permease [Streptomyces sp. SID8499]